MNNNPELVRYSADIFFNGELVNTVTDFKDSDFLLDYITDMYKDKEAGYTYQIYKVAYVTVSTGGLT